MINIIKILFLLLSITLISCSKEEKISVLEEENVELQMIDAFEDISFKALSLNVNLTPSSLNNS